QGCSACEGPHAVGEFWSANVSLISCAEAEPVHASNTASRPATVRLLFSGMRSLPRADRYFSFSRAARAGGNSAVAPAVRQGGARRSKRHHQSFERSVAIHEIDPLPGDLNAIGPPHQAMEAGAAEHPLRLPAIFQ